MLDPTPISHILLAIQFSIVNYGFINFRKHVRCLITDDIIKGACERKNYAET